MTATSPYHFRPMDQLVDEGRKVEIAQRDGRVVIGFRLKGSVWSNDGNSHHRIDPIGWREIEKDWSAYRKDEPATHSVAERP